MNLMICNKWAFQHDMTARLKILEIIDEFSYYAILFSIDHFKYIKNAIKNECDMIELVIIFLWKEIRLLNENSFPLKIYETYERLMIKVFKNYEWTD